MSLLNHEWRLRLRMRIERNERAHKVFIIHATTQSREQGNGADFRILTKEIPGCSIELLAYSYWFDGVDEHQSGVLRAPAVPRQQLTDLIRRVVERTGTDIQQMEVLDLTLEPTRMDQADRLAQHDLLDAFDFQ